jgi:cell division protease FtsH
VFFEDVTTGAADDLRKVTEMARGIVTRYGMSETLGLLTYDRQQQTMAGMPVPNGARSHAEQTAREIDTEARAIVDAAHERALATIRAHRDAVARTAETLLEVETMDGPALRRALGLDT